MNVSKEEFDRALDAGLTAAYKVRSRGFLGSNLEEKLRVGLTAALEMLEVSEVEQSLREKFAGYQEVITAITEASTGEARSQRPAGTEPSATPPVAAASPEGAPTVHYCPEKQKPGGCQLHNLHCGYPECDKTPAASEDIVVQGMASGAAQIDTHFPPTVRDTPDWVRWKAHLIECAPCTAGLLCVDADSFLHGASPDAAPWLTTSREDTARG